MSATDSPHQRRPQRPILRSFRPRLEVLPQQREVHPSTNGDTIHCRDRDLGELDHFLGQRSHSATSGAAKAYPVHHKQAIHTSCETRGASSARQRDVRGRHGQTGLALGGSKRTTPRLDVALEDLCGHCAVHIREVPSSAEGSTRPRPPELGSTA